MPSTPEVLSRPFHSLKSRLFPAHSYGNKFTLMGHILLVGQQDDQMRNHLNDLC